ncbi:MAG: nuclear transport factor 2 family protein [Planctomycetota bacterium]|jgi:ketosteroid isomerase-like protein
MTTTGTTSLLEKTKQILEMIKEGKFVEGMEQFYADDAVNEEPTGATIEGKAAIIEHEKNILKQVAAFHGVDVKSVAVAEDDGDGNGVTIAEYSMQVDMKDGSKFNPDQVQVTRWKNGRAVHNKFYYNPNF